jgi:hypothetical protein
LAKFPSKMAKFCHSQFCWMSSATEICVVWGAKELAC